MNTIQRLNKITNSRFSHLIQFLWIKKKIQRRRNCNGCRYHKITRYHFLNQLNEMNLLSKWKKKQQFYRSAKRPLFIMENWRKKTLKFQEWNVFEIYHAICLLQNILLSNKTFLLVISCNEVHGFSSPFNKEKSEVKMHLKHFDSRLNSKFTIKSMKEH